MPIKERFVYFGSFYRSAEILEHIVNAGYMPAAIVCGPDRPAGRDRALTPPAVKKLVLEKDWKVEVLQPEKVPDSIPRLKEIAADFFIVMGYAQIIPQSVLDLPRLGTIGVHPSLLPKYRGASPMQSALLAGETETGVTLYMMDNKMDHGPIIATQKFPIAEGENDISLGHKAARVAGELLVKTLPSFVAGSSAAREQDHAQATFTKKFTATDGQVDMQKDAPLTMYRKIKALNPEPSVWTMNFPGREGVRVKLLDATWVDEKLKITEIQPAGKKPFKV